MSSMLDKTWQKMAAGTGVGLVACYAAYQVYKLVQKRRTPQTVVGRVSQLWIYPIKACAGLAIENAQCTITGLKYHSVCDRQYTVVSPNGECFGLSSRPALAFVKTAIDVENNCLLLTAKGQSEFNLSLEPPKYSEDKVLNINWYGGKIFHKGLDCGDAVAQWFTRYLGEESRLVFFHDQIEKHVPLINHLYNRKSRPKVTSEEWRTLKIGSGAEFFNERTCPRCPVITVDPNTAIKSDKHQPLKTLVNYHRGKGNDKVKGVMGIQLVLECESEEYEVNIGDAVIV